MLFYFSISAVQLIVVQCFAGGESVSVYVGFKTHGVRSMLDCVKVSGFMLRPSFEPYKTVCVIIFLQWFFYSLWKWFVVSLSKTFVVSLSG